MYDYIVDNALYSLEGQQGFAKSADWPRGRHHSDGSELDTGSIFIKAAWKELATDDTASDFQRLQAWLFNPGTSVSDPSCRLALVGLVGFHVVHRTRSAPQWVWSTFEHVANAPQYDEAMSGDLPLPHYSYFPLSCTKGACQYNELPSYPWDPDNGTRTGVNVVRLAKIGSAAAAANQSWHSSVPVAGTVFENYVLVDVQFATVLGVSVLRRGLSHQPGLSDWRARRAVPLQHPHRDLYPGLRGRLAHLQFEPRAAP